MWLCLFQPGLKMYGGQNEPENVPSGKNTMVILLGKKMFLGKLCKRWTWFPSSFLRHPGVAEHIAIKSQSIP